MLLLALFALLALLAEGQVDDVCTFKYYTVNTYKPQNSFSFSCYGIDSDCEVYYTPPGSGCNGDLSTLIGTVPANETQVFTFEIGFELGGGFCSEYQIDVYYADEADKVEAHLPRAIDAGTNFHIPLSKKTISRIFDCTMSALSLPVNATISVNDTETLVSIDSFTTMYFVLNHNLTPIEVVTMIKSDNPVIVSCFFFEVLVTFQPISSKPLLLVSRLDEFVSLAISDCSTNELIQNFSKVNVTSEAYKNESPCTYNQHDTDKLQVFEVKSSYCYFYVEPLDNACISMTTISSATSSPTSVGIPESRFSTRSVYYPDVADVTFFSFSQTYCLMYFHELSTVEPTPELFMMKLNVYKEVSFAILSEQIGGDYEFSRFDCTDPVLVVEGKRWFVNPILSGYLQEELWQPFFESQCFNSSSLTPATSGNTPPGNNPSGNNPSGNNPPGNNPPGPASSDTRSLVSCTSWLALFGFYVLYTSLV